MGQVVDTPSAQEFMREAMQKITIEQLDAIEREVATKSALFRDTLTSDRIGGLSDDELQPVLHSIFAIRRKSKDLNDPHLRERIEGLLFGEADLAVRFQSFCDALPQLETNVRCDFASELLHYTRPDDYWLWTRWMWDPETETGSLRLVTMDDFDLHAPTLAETYLRVGEAMAFVNETGQAAGFTRIGEPQGAFGADVFLACVYAIYTYTVLRLRMTNEFNKVMPELPEMARRLLGVWDKKAHGIRKIVA